MSTPNQNEVRKRVQAEKYLDNILNFKPLTTSKQSLARFMDIFISSVNHLKSLDLGDLSEYILYSVAMRKLDFKTRSAFEAIVINENMKPMVDDLVKFIDKQRAHQDIVSQCLKENSNLSVQTNGYESVKDKGKQVAPTSANLENQNNGLSGTQSQSLQSDGRPSGNTLGLNARGKMAKKRSSQKDKNACLDCQTGVHAGDTCPLFLNLGSRRRGFFVRVNRLCRRCLKSYHGQSSCENEKKCEKCQAKHHTLIHIDKPLRSNQKSFTVSNSNRNNKSQPKQDVTARDVETNGNPNQGESSQLADKGNKESALSKKVKPKDCIACGKEYHPLDSCDVFNSYDHEKCLDLIKRNKVCANCFDPKHTSRTCLNESNCDQCKAKHHAKLHLTNHTQLFDPVRKSDDFVPKENDQEVTKEERVADSDGCSKVNGTQDSITPDDLGVQIDTVCKLGD